MKPFQARSFCGYAGEVALISIRALTKRYGASVTALDSLTVDIEHGIVGLVGSNGGTLTALLVVPSTVLSAILLAVPSADMVWIATALALGVLAGSYVYVAIFAALSIITSRGLLLGLGYALIWEGLLAGLLPGTQVFSVREYVRGIVHLVSPSVIDSVVGNGAVLFAAIALVAALAIASYRLATYEVRGSY